MKKLINAMYRFLGAATMFVAVMSITELNSFCILIIHQPEIPNSLKERVGLIEQK